MCACIDPAFDLSDTPVPHRPPAETPFTVERLESEATVVRRYTLHMLAECEGNKSQAAKVLGIDRRSVYRRLGLG
jgi:transcriptional regulator of acetoin/glycerol metabolism